MVNVFFGLSLVLLLFSSSSSLAECGSLKDTVRSESGFYFPENGFVKNKDLAIQVADVFLTSIYGKDIVASEKPLTALLLNGVWEVKGTQLPGYRGGVVSIYICKKTGEILGVARGR